MCGLEDTELSWSKQDEEEYGVALIIAVIEQLSAAHQGCTLAAVAARWRKL